MKLYMHAGSANHGCEALVRSIVKLVKTETDTDVIVFSEYPNEDIDFGLDSICKVYDQGHRRNKKDLFFVIFKILEIVFKSKLKYKYLYSNIINQLKLEENEVYFSIGGDNYCYNCNPNLAFLNTVINETGNKTVLWGCSIEPESLLDKTLVEDLRKYSLVVARESITYNALLAAGVVKNVFLAPDPAFVLDISEPEMKDIQLDKDIVGINISSLAQSKEAVDGLYAKNICNLIDHILDNYQFDILFIPHVDKKNNSDSKIINEIYRLYRNNKRVYAISNRKLNCQQLKYIISKCRFMIASRTHASIASYSAQIPTLVIGYSVKARGIARDIFGDEENYLINVEEMRYEDDLTKKFSWIMEHEQEIKSTLETVMPEYISRTKKSIEYLKVLGKDNENSH